MMRNATAASPAAGNRGSAARGSSAQRTHAARRCAGSGRTRRRIGREILRLLELVLADRKLELVRRSVRARHDLEGSGSQRDLLGAHAQETADAHHEGFNLARPVEQDVADGADLLAVSTDDLGALEFGR